MSNSSVIDTESETGDGYSYSSDIAKYDPETEEDYLGFSLHHTDVGVADSEAVYFQQSSNYVHDADIEDIREGNIVRLNYKSRTVNTPFRVALIKTGEVIHKEWNSYNRGGTYTRTIHPYMALLDPINNTTQTTLISGRCAEETDIVSINRERKIPVDTTTVQELATHLDELVSTECPHEPQEVVRQYPHGEIKDDAKLIEVATDQTIARLFKINAPLLFISEI